MLALSDLGAKAIGHTRVPFERHIFLSFLQKIDRILCFLVSTINNVYILHGYKEVKLEKSFKLH